jgi:biotin transporter BioY
MAVSPDLPERPGFLARLLFAIPVLGWMLRDLARREEALPWFVASLVGVGVLAFLKLGMAGLVLVMLLATALCLGAILLITRG